MYQIIYQNSDVQGSVIWAASMASMQVHLGTLEYVCKATTAILVVLDRADHAENDADICIHGHDSFTTSAMFR